MVSNATLPVNATEICELSPHATFFSTVIGAYISTIIGGVTGGYFVPFFTAWISWLACLRIIIVGLWQLGLTLILRPAEGGDEWYAFARRFLRVTSESDFARGDATESDDVTIFGWFGWAWGVCYAPIIQVLWLVKNWSEASGELLIVRGLSVSVVALPLTMDTRARYGKSMGECVGGRVSQWLFSLVTTASLVTLGVISTTELGVGIVRALPPSIRWVVIFPALFMVLWAWMSFQFVPPLDVPFSTTSSLHILGGFAMGCFAGGFVAAPSFAMMMRAAHAPGLSIPEYVKCQSISWWARAVTILP